MALDTLCFTLHHRRRAEGTTLCGILADDDNPVRQRNCLLWPSKQAGRSSRIIYQLGNFNIVQELVAEMKQQGTRVIAVEGYELPYMVPE